MSDSRLPSIPPGFGRSPGTGLLVPRVAEPAPSLNPGRLVATYVGYGQIHGEPGDWEDAVERLREYDLSTILETIGRVSAAVHAGHQGDSIERQAKLCRWLFKDSAGPVLSTAQEMLESAREAGTALRDPVRIFHDLQLANAAKLAILEVDAEDALSASGPERLGEALLIVNDLLGHEETLGNLPTVVDGPEERRQWGRFMLVNGAFHSFGNPMYELARSRELYLTDRSDLEGVEDTFELPAVVEEITGLPLPQLLGRLMAVYMRWGKGLDDETGELPTSLRVDTAFTANFDFTPEEEANFWPLVAASAEELRSQFLDAGCGDGVLRPYYVLPFERRPLVQLSERAYAPSVRILGEKVSTGLHYLILNGLPEEAGDRYLRYLGHAFANYVGDILRRIFRDGTGRYVTEETLRERAPEGSRVCDGVIVYPDAAVPLEIKATHLPFAARSEGDWDAFEGFLERVFWDGGAPQLHSTIEMIEEGALADTGLVPARIRRYLPAVVTLEPLAMQPLVYEEIASELDRRRLLSEPKIAPLQHLSVDDVEMLETATSRGRSLLRILEERVDSGGHQLSFTNYAWLRDRSLLDGGNEYLRQRFDEMADVSIRYLSERRTDRGESTTGQTG